MKGKANRRMIACLVLTLMYVAGLILMLMKNLQWGLVLWAASTVAGMGVLYHIKKQDAAEAERRAEEEERGEN